MLKTDKSWIAKNLKVGAIYMHDRSFEAMRLITILPCQGVWMETAAGEGYGETIPFDEVLYATDEEVEDFLEDFRERKA
jgi:hypothetical protein